MAVLNWIYWIEMNGFTCWHSTGMDFSWTTHGNVVSFSNNFSNALSVKSIRSLWGCRQIQFTKDPHCNIWSCRDVARFSQSTTDLSMRSISHKSVQQNIYISFFHSKLRIICTCTSMQHISDKNCKKLPIESAYSTCMLQQLLLLLLSNELFKKLSQKLRQVQQNCAK